MPAPLVIVAVVAAAAIGISYALSTDARTRRALKKRRVVAIRGLAPGEVARVRGRVVAVEDQLSAPLSTRACVYYLTTVEQRSGNNNSHWREAAREERYADFAIDDGTGAVQVCMSVPQVAVVRDVKTRSGTFDDASEVEEEFLRRHGMKSTNFLGLNSELRYTEGVIEPGEEVTVLGLVRTEVRAGKQLLVLDARDDGPLLVSDDPRAVRAD